MILKKPKKITLIRKRKNRNQFQTKMNLESNKTN